ncbi:MAG: L-seryl-tRNA(Sec) selenium transferase [Planctomycetota bacterium]|nr:L-seryl-tRNA(Sec) selenium transferase [Planctomycetota bacterium]
MASKSSASQKALRAVPAVQKLLDEPALMEAQSRFGRDAVVAAAREVLDELREKLRGNGGAQPPETSVLAVQAAARAGKRSLGGIRKAINATGVILHTGLGRAVLPEAALRDIAQELGGYAIVEVDIETGQRGQRDLAAADLMRTILGCEAATVVNNNAAATMLALAAVARGKEVIVSRGQLVEIGGGFRVPEVLAESGAKMIEVGTTNRTHLRDYERAITPETAALLAVHPSNFRIVGFTAEPGIAELAELGRKHNLPVIHDIGSGALLPDLAEELRHEPAVKASLDAGASLVTFSCDKILGGPQAGFAVGRADLVEKLRRHPLYRAFRLDKLILRALESTLALYLDAGRRGETVPTLRMLRRPLAEIAAVAEALAQRLREQDVELDAGAAEDSSRLGSGSLPERDIPTRVVRLRHPRHSAEELAARLRAHTPPIFARIQDERVLIDPRTLQAGEEEEIVRALAVIE